MLRRFPLANEDYRNVPAIALFEHGIRIYIHFPELSAEFLQKRRDGRLGFVAKMASRARVESNVARAGSGKADVFVMSAHRFVATLHHTGEQAPLGRTSA